MSDAPQPQYFQLRTNMSRANCSYLLEQYRLDPATGLLASVSVYEDGLAYYTAPAPFRVPVLAVPSTAAAFAAARYQALRSMARRRVQQREEKALRKRVEEMRRGLAALATKPAAPERSEASLPQQTVEPVVEPLNSEKLVAKPVEASLSQLVAPAPPAPMTGLLDDITVLDTEFVPEGAHLIEVAAIRYVNQEPREAFVSFVAFTGYLPRFVTELTGITALHLHGAPSEKEVMGLLRQYVGDSLLVCHNVPADKRVIEATRTRLGATAELPNAWLCTMALARRLGKAGVLPKDLKVGLADLCHHFRIKRRGEHRAKADVLMTFQVLRKLHELQAVTKADLHGAPVPGKAKKNTVPAGPGLFAAA